MPKRFTDTAKWSKPFLRKIPMEYKLFWLYILDECDHAGIWQVDFEVAALKMGIEINEPDALKYFTGKIRPFHNNEKWFIQDFIEFQYGKLNENIRAHKSVISILNKYELLAPPPKINPLLTVSVTAKDKDKDMDMDKDMDKEGGAGEDSDPDPTPTEPEKPKLDIAANILEQKQTSESLDTGSARGFTSIPTIQTNRANAKQLISPGNEQQCEDVLRIVGKADREILIEVLKQFNSHRSAVGEPDALYARYCGHLCNWLRALQREGVNLIVKFTPPPPKPREKSVYETYGE